MTLKEWLSFGGNEVANNPRAFGYARSAGCAGWFTRQGCPTLWEALGDLPYDYANISEAPWYDATLADVSSRFFGVYVLDISGLLDSTRSAQVTQNTGDGGQIGSIRRATKESKVKAFLLARGSDAMDYGRAWLDRVLSPGACGQHGEMCGVSDVEFLTTCPPSREGYSDDEYDDLLRPMQRYLHDVAVTSGPFTVEEASDGRIFSEVVEWTFTSERPWVYGRIRDVDLPSVPSSVVADVPVNLAAYPSAELTSGTPLLGTNLMTNPSLETNSTNWSGGATTGSGSSVASFYTGARVTGERAAQGTASWRARILGSGAAAAAGVAEIYSVAYASLSAVPVGGRVSVTAWGYFEKLDTAPGTVLNRIRALARFRNSGGGTVQDVTIGSTTDPDDFPGYTFSMAGIEIPAGAVDVQVLVLGLADWVSAASAGAALNSDVRLYADAVAVTTP